MGSRLANYEQLQDSTRELAKDAFHDHYSEWKDSYTRQLFDHLVRNGIPETWLREVDVVDSDEDENGDFILYVGVTVFTRESFDAKMLNDAAKGFRFSYETEDETSFQIDVDDFDEYQYDITFRIGTEAEVDDSLTEVEEDGEMLTYFFTLKQKMLVDIDL